MCKHLNRAKEERDGDLDDWVGIPVVLLGLVIATVTVIGPESHVPAESRRNILFLAGFMIVVRFALMFTFALPGWAS